jgi:proteasome lid subunit RPN8/RPN11
MNFPDTLLLIQKLARQSPRKEICGLIDSEGGVFPVKNVSTDKHKFVMDRREYLKALIDCRQQDLSVVAVYHSHLSADTSPSPADVKAIAACKLPGLIVSAATTNHTWVPYVPTSPQ